MPLQFLQKLITYPTITPQECGIYELILNKLNSLIKATALLFCGAY